MVAANRVRELFADARVLHADALEMLAQGRIRNAAEKGWGATKRATDALILARTGRAPTITSHTSGGICALGQENDALASLRVRFGYTAQYLHADCFYDGRCEPEEFIAELVRDTMRYIEDAEAMAGGV